MKRLIIPLMLLLCVSFVLADNWVVNGSAVYVDDNNVYISAD